MDKQPKRPDYRRQYPHHATMIEFAGIILLIACFTIVVLTLMGPAVGNVFSDVLMEF